MSWRSVVIANPAKLSLQNNHLRISQDEDVLVPLEDINVIVVETGQVTMTARLLDALATAAVPLFTCDEKHLPSGVFLPFQPHSRVLKVQEMQLKSTLPFRKNCWRTLVQCKIRNQARCMDILEIEGSRELYAIASEVKSGDPTNRESVASRFYFNRMMPGVSRTNECTLNAALDYGYAIIRGAMARSLVSYGFLPAHGIHHKNELNAFNLADDFMEVFRPVVDLWVFSNIENWEGFGPGMRQRLVALLQSNILINDERQTQLRAMDIVSVGYASACRNKDPNALCFPDLLPQSEHVYE